MDFHGVILVRRTCLKALVGVRMQTQQASKIILKQFSCLLQPIKLIAMMFCATGLYAENFRWPKMNVCSRDFRNAFIGQLQFSLSSLKSVDGCYDPLRMT